VGLSGFDERAAQLDLFSSADVEGADATSVPTPEERVKLVRGIDAVRAKFGDSAVRYGRELKAPAGRSRPAGDATDEARSRPRDD